MSQKEYTVNIGNLKVSGIAEEIHKLANVYGLASCEYGHQIVEEINGEHHDNLIKELLAEQKALNDIQKQFIDAIRDSDYYKQYSAEMLNMVESILEEIESGKR